MDRLKTLRTFSWAAVERQAETLFNAIRAAQQQGLTMLEYKGVIHQVNVDILKANGFLFSYKSGDTMTITWTSFIDIVDDDETYSTDDESDDGCCKECPCPKGSRGQDNIKNVIMNLLSSLDSKST